MTDPRAVKRALRLLAGGAEPTPDDPDVIDRAADAVDDLDGAATFLERHGIEPLRRAVRDAERRSDRARARRGQRALAAVEWFRRVA